MSRLPEQEFARGTYYEDLVANFHINEVTPQSSGHTVMAAWTAILGFVFPQPEGYLTRRQAAFGTGPSDLFTSQVVTRLQHDGAQMTDKFAFFIVECKSSIHESDSSTWGEGRDQLGRCLEGMTRPRGPTPLDNPLYGAVAVGRYVRVFSFDQVTRRITDLLGDGAAPLHIARECETVNGWLR